MRAMTAPVSISPVGIGIATGIYGDGSCCILIIDRSASASLSFKLLTLHYS